MLMWWCPSDHPAASPAGGGVSLHQRHYRLEDKLLLTLGLQSCRGERDNYNYLAKVTTSTRAGNGSSRSVHKKSLSLLKAPNSTFTFNKTPC